jgi:hypothetical protein
LALTKHRFLIACAELGLLKTVGISPLSYRSRHIGHRGEQAIAASASSVR